MPLLGCIRRCQGKSKFETLIVKIFSLKQKANQILSAATEKNNFFSSRKQSKVPLDKVLQWRNVKQKPSRQI